MESKLQIWIGITVFEAILLILLVNVPLIEYTSQNQAASCAFFNGVPLIGGILDWIAQGICGAFDSIFGATLVSNVIGLGAFSFIFPLLIGLWLYLGFSLIYDAASPSRTP
jgi:hypothetical protein